MGNWIHRLALACFAGLATASPLPTKSNQPDKFYSKRQFDFGDLGDQFKGINWDSVSEQCDDFQFNILLGATYSAVKTTQLKTAEHENTPAWNRYFGGANPVKDTRWLDDEAEPTYMNIRNNLVQVSQFPTEGKPRNGRLLRSRQVEYRCREVENFNKCADGPDEDGRWHGPSAYTADTRASEAGWAIVFCPRFFQDKQSAMLIAGRENEGMREPSQIHELYTFEHLMIHEWMHVDLFGYKEHIADIKGSIGHGWEGEFPIYGDKNCHYFAWKDHPNLNIEVALNADSYAWFFTYNHFHYYWGWNSDGRFETRKRSVEEWQDEILWDEASDVNGFTPETELEQIDWEAPMNVFMNDEHLEDDGDSVVSVGYIGESYEVFEKAYNDKADYVAVDSDCMLSWQCRNIFGHSLDPECTCTCDGEVIGDDFWNDKRCKGIQVGSNIQV